MSVTLSASHELSAAEISYLGFFIVEMKARLSDMWSATNHNIVWVQKSQHVEEVTGLRRQPAKRWVKGCQRRTLYLQPTPALLFHKRMLEARKLSIYSQGSNLRA